MSTDSMEPSKNKAATENVRAKQSGQPSDKAKMQPPLNKELPSYGPEAHHERFLNERSFFNWICAGFLGFICLAFALAAHHFFGPGLRAGDIADRDLIATRATLVVNEAATSQKRNEARLSAMPVFKADKDADDHSIQDLHSSLNSIQQMHKLGLEPMSAKTSLGAKEQLTILLADEAQFNKETKELAQRTQLSGTRNSAKKSVGSDLQNIIVDQFKNRREALFKFKNTHPQVGAQASEKEYLIALSVNAADLETYNKTVEDAAARMCKIHRLEQDPTSWAEVAEEYLPDKWPGSLRKATAFLIASTLKPNLEIDRQATKDKGDKLASAVRPVMKEINVGQLIISKHGILTDENVKILQAAGVTENNRWPFVFGLAVSLAAAVSLIALFLYALEPKHLFSTTSVALMYSVSALVFVIASFWGKTYPQLVPLPLAALILTIFLGQRVAVAITISIAIFLSVDGLLDVTNLMALGTAAGAAIGFYSRKRQSIMSTGLIMSVAQGAGFFAAAASIGAMNTTQLVEGVGYEFLGGIILAILAIGSLPFLENIFGMLTPFRLAELTNADQPLLRKLEENAPGTYQHSLAVANLAEAGARAISADVNLVRAGAYYHDIGKMVRPRYFIENQLGDKNPHDSMSPEDSRERVLAHVTDGLALAKEHKLPKAVQDFIPMHQGTSLMAYFYHKACLRDGIDNVETNSYRYPGPKPQSKETAIVMLADVSEAVTHSMHDPSQAEVEDAMTKVFQNRWDDGQFSESSLTYAELEGVKKAFVHVWRTLHHERLKYPSTTTGRMAVPPDTIPLAFAPHPASEPGSTDAENL